MDEPKTGLPASLFAAVEKHMQPEADAEERPARLDVPQDRLHQPQPLQAAHRVGCRADTRQHQHSRILDGGCPVGDGGQRAKLLEGLGYAPKIACAVIHDHQS